MGCITQTPNVQLGCSTVNAPSPAPQPATVSIFRRSVRKTAWMAADAPVNSHWLPLFLSLTLVLMVTPVFFSG